MAGEGATVITSKNAPHYIGFGDLGWLWVKNYRDAKVFPTREEAEVFVRTWLSGMENDVWYLKG